MVQYLTESSVCPLRPLQVNNYKKHERTDSPNIVPEVFSAEVSSEVKGKARTSLCGTECYA